jgi:ribonuclease HI
MLHVEPTPPSENLQQPLPVQSKSLWLRLPHRLLDLRGLLGQPPSLNLATALGFVLAFALLVSGQALFATFLGLAAMGLHTLILVVRDLLSKLYDKSKGQTQTIPVAVAEKTTILDKTVMKLVDTLPDHPAFQLLSTNKAFLIYADASCQDHVPWRPGAWATLTVANGETLERTGAMFCATAQETEAMSILEAVRVLPKGAGAVVVNDCQMVIQALNGATPFLDKNTSRIVKGTKALIAQRRLNIKFIWMTETTPEHQQVHKLAKKTAKVGL